MKYTTLNRLQAHGPCSEGRGKLLKFLGKTETDDEPLSYLTILESNGLDDALWCCMAEPQYDKEWRLYAVWCARQVEHLLTDERSINAINVAEAYANGNASEDELVSARAAAWSVTPSAHVSSAARSAAWSAVSSAARSAAWSAAWSAASSAHVSSAARSAAWSAASSAARSIARLAEQIEKFKEVCRS